MINQRPGNQSALEGLRIVECATVIAAPLCGRLMADFGAEVIHIEHPEKGDPLRAMGFTVDGINPWWSCYDRNKKLITLNISKSEGRELLFRLLEDVDIFIENFRPGRLEAWGIDCEELLEKNPRLIIVRLTGFGQTGPYSEQPGFGTLAESMSGFAEMTGDPDGHPTLPQFALADHIAAFYATQAAMFAIYNRDVVGTNRGQIIDVSIWECMFSVLGPNALVYQMTGSAPTRMGNRATTHAGRNTYKTKDDRWAAISAPTQTIVARLFDAMGQPDLIEDSRFDTNANRLKNVEELDQIISAWFASYNRDDAVEILRKHEVAVAPVYDISDIVADPHAKAREMIVNGSSDGSVRLEMEGVFPKFSSTPGSVRHGGRELGYDNDEIYSERLGLSKAKIEELVSSHII